jgi:DNA-binding NarL/FixJ family response regulator
LSAESVYLTRRQLEVLRLLAEGQSTTQIAASLGVSRTTVRNYIANLLSALGAHSRLEAVVAARRIGILHD